MHKLCKLYDMSSNMQCTCCYRIGFYKLSNNIFPKFKYFVEIQYLIIETYNRFCKMKLRKVSIFTQVVQTIGFEF